MGKKKEGKETKHHQKLRFFQIEYVQMIDISIKNLKLLRREDIVCQPFNWMKAQFSIWKLFWQNIFYKPANQ